MDLDPKIIAAIIGLLAVVVSAVVSYVVSKKIESSKTTIEYLNRKILVLEERKSLLAKLGFEEFGEGVNKENFTEKYIDALAEKHKASSGILREIDHYLNKQLVAKIEKITGEINATIGTEGLEKFLEIPMPVSPKSNPEVKIKLIKNLSESACLIKTAIDEELRASVEKIESLGGLK